MGYPPSNQEKDFAYWRFEPMRALQLSGNKLRGARFVESSGRYPLFADIAVGYGSAQTTLCFDFPTKYDIKTSYETIVNYDIHCFDLHTSDLLTEYYL